MGAEPGFAEVLLVISILSIPRTPIALSSSLQVLYKLGTDWLGVVLGGRWAGLALVSPGGSVLRIHLSGWQEPELLCSWVGKIP